MNTVEITRKTEYAINSLVELASNPGEHISSKTIAERQEIPVNFLPQIMALLTAKGWVEGVRGPGGGVLLQADPKAITIRDVVELIEGPIAIVKCMTEENGCPRGGLCPVRPVWQRAQGAFVGVLENVSIADLV